MLIPLMVFLAWIVIVGPLLFFSHPKLTILEIFNQSIIKFPLYATLGFVCVGIIASGIIYCTESMLQSVEQVQKKLGEDTNSDKELEIAGMNPSTRLEILEPEMSFSDSDSDSYTGCSRTSDRDCMILGCAMM